MTIAIHDIIPTQDYIRNERQVPCMIDFVSTGGIFTEDVIESYKPNSSMPHSLIRLTQFDDGALFLSDGHHRVIAMLESGREVLQVDEFYIERWSYEAYQEVIFTYPNGKWMGWVTPHDPWKEIRLPDLSEFKFQVKALFHREGEESALKYIKSNRSKYCRPRTVHTIQELADNYLMMKDSTGLFPEKYRELSEQLDSKMEELR